MPDDRYAVIAESHGVCPICARFIAAGRSKIAALKVAQPPDLDAVEFSPRLGWHLMGAERTTSVRPRLWAHKRCADRWNAELTHDEQDRIAADRRAELRAHRLAVLAHHSDGARVQRPKRRRNP